MRILPSTPDNYFKHIVGDKELRFRRLRLPTLTVCGPLIKRLGSLLALFRTDWDKRAGGIEQYDDESVTKSFSPWSHELVQSHQAAQVQIVNTFEKLLASPDSQEALVKIIFDSLRDEFEGKPNDADRREFIEEVDLKTLLEYMIGVFKANKDLLSPLMASGAVSREEVLSMADKVRMKMGLGETETESTSGQDSNSASSSSSDEATP